MVSPLLDQVPGAFASVTADGTYDAEPVCRAVLERQPHLQGGRCGWQKGVGYGQRALVETAMFRYGVLIGPTLRTRKWAAQKIEARLACSMIHRITPLERPLSQRVR